MIDLSKYHVVNCFGTPLEKYPFEEEIEFCLKHIRAGDTVIDVGANAAYYTLPISDAVGATGRVEAFEPSKKYSEFFAKNMSQCAVANAGNWSLYSLAVGRDCNAARLVHSGQTGSTTGLYTAGADENSPDPKVNIKLAQALIKGVWIYGTGGAAKALAESIERKDIIGFIDTFLPDNSLFMGLPVKNVNYAPQIHQCILLTGVFRWQMQAELDKRGIKDYMHIATPGEVVTVPQTTIDAFVVGNLPVVDFIKIDTDGGEADVLEGADATLATRAPKIFSEVNILHNAARRIYDLLARNDYSVYFWPSGEEIKSGYDMEFWLEKCWANGKADGMNIFAEAK